MSANAATSRFVYRAVITALLAAAVSGGLAGAAWLRQTAGELVQVQSRLDGVSEIQLARIEATRDRLTQIDARLDRVRSDLLEIRRQSQDLATHVAGVESRLDTILRLLGQHGDGDG